MRQLNKKLIFPFGQELKKVVQTEREPKDIFVLGVYSSAVHAKWIDKDRKVVIQALVVASEPYIFWHGDDAEEVIKKITIPEELGKLKVANKNLNGPSGKALDEKYLEPLGCSRSNAWLCNLVPHSCLNPNQLKAIQQRYNPLTEEYGLPEVSIPELPKILAEQGRVQEILSEIKDARPKLIILLGNQPIKWFLSPFAKQYKELKGFGYTGDAYGRVHTFEIEDSEYYFLPLIHPRQAAGIGNHSKDLRQLHAYWAENTAPLVKKECLL